MAFITTPMRLNVPRNTKVTMYIPNYNCYPYIEECLKSVCFQSWPNMEILIGDDGSTDGSLEVCREFAKKDNRIKLFESTTPHGVGGNINEILSTATGEFAAVLAADDMLLPSFWELTLPYFSTPEVGFVSVGLITVGQVNFYYPVLSYIQPRRWNTMIEIFDVNLVYGTSPFRMEMWRQVDGHDREVGPTGKRRMYADWDFWIKAVLNNWRVNTCINPVYFYRLRERSATSVLQKDGDMRNEEMAFYRNKYKDIMAQLGLKPAPEGSESLGVPI